MQVVMDTRIVGKIKNAINEAEGAIERIELTEEEMHEFLDAHEFKLVVDKHYGSADIPAPLHIQPAKPGQVPRSCWYLGVYIVRV